MDFDLWIGAIVGILVIVWPQRLLSRAKHLTQAELSEISSEYNSINASYGREGLVFVLIAIGLAFLWAFDMQWLEPEQLRVIAPFWIVLILSLLGFMRGYFAIRHGVYPTSRFLYSRTQYAYEEGSRIHQLGRLQIYSALAAVIIALMIGIVRCLMLS